MARPTKNEDGPQVRRSISIPKNVDCEIDEYAGGCGESYSGTVVKAWAFFSGSTNKDDLQQQQQNAGKDNAC
jgi:hypothetical protein